MGLLHRLVRAGAIAVIGLAITGLTGAYASSGVMAARASGRPRFVAVPGSLPRTTDAITGGYHSSRMSIEVSLPPRNPLTLNRILKALYTRHSRMYHRWLAKGQFDALFAPRAATRAAVAHYLSGQGLTVQRSSSPFLVRAAGSSRRVSAAFRTTLSTYRNHRGASYYSNSSAVRLPAALAPKVLGVIGLSSTVREHSQVKRFTGAARPAGTPGSMASCEAPYPTARQLFDFFNGIINGFPTGYGGGPGCNGLTPAQDNSIYGASHVGPRGKGAGVNIAVFELTAYLPSDINTWTRQFYGPGFHAPLVDVNVDGGPLNPACPAGDQCPPNVNGYAGDVEVNADIEMQLAISPDVGHLIVYNAPNDFTGQTERSQPVLGPAVLPARSRRYQPIQHIRQRDDPVLAGRDRHAVPRGSRHLGQRGRVHAVCRVLHRQCEHAVRPVRLQRRPDSARVVRNRRHQPVVAAAVGDHRRPRQLPRRPQRQHQPAAVSPGQHRAALLLPRHHRSRPGHRRQRPLPGHPGYDEATGIGTPRMAALITVAF